MTNIKINIYGNRFYYLRFGYVQEREKENKKRNSLIGKC